MSTVSFTDRKKILIAMLELARVAPAEIPNVVRFAERRAAKHAKTGKGARRGRR